MKDLTTGSLRRHILVMSLACLTNMVSGTLFSLANIYWVGKIGASAQAAVTLATIPVMMVLAMLPVVSVGAAILVSHAVGAKDRDRANRIFNEAFAASWMVTTLIALSIWLNRESFAAFLTTDSEAAAEIVTYYRWFIPSVVVQIPMLVMAGAYASTGNIRVATLAQSGTVILNMVLVPVLMFGWLGTSPLGIEGTGLASFIACSIGLLGLFLFSLRPRSYLVLSPSIWFSCPKELWSALRIGLPTGLESGVVAAYLMALALMMKPFDATEMAGFGVGQRLLQAGLLPLMALSSATGIVVGQNFGAGFSDRVRGSLRACLSFGLILAPLVMLLFHSVPHWILGRFSDDIAVIEAGVRFIRISSFSLLPAGIAYAIFAVFAGTGNTRIGLYCSLIYGTLVVFPAWVLSSLPGFNPGWLWMVMVVATVLQAMIAVYLFRRAFSSSVRPHQGVSEDAIRAA